MSPHIYTGGTRILVCVTPHIHRGYTHTLRETTWQPFSIYETLNIHPTYTLYMFTCMTPYMLTCMTPYTNPPSIHTLPQENIAALFNIWHPTYDYTPYPPYTLLRHPTYTIKAPFIHTDGMHTLLQDNVAVFFQYMTLYIHIYTRLCIVLYTHPAEGMHTLLQDTVAAFFNVWHSTNIPYMYTCMTP